MQSFFGKSRLLCASTIRVTNVGKEKSATLIRPRMSPRDIGGSCDIHDTISVGIS
jgi:hypothetical protein